MSTDYGATWSAPVVLGSGFFGVLDVQVTLDGEVFVLAMQRDPEVAPVLLQRTRDGVWQERADIPLRSVWYASSGAIALLGEGADASVVALLTATLDQPNTVYLARRPLMGGDWEVSKRTIATDGAVFTGVRAVSYGYRAAGTSQPGASFVMVARDGASVYTLTTLDGGASWTAGDQVAQGGTAITAAGIGYDGAAQHLVTIWNCCTDAGWGGAAAATHYAAAAPAGSSSWTPDPATTNRTPLISGARAASLTTVVHAANAQIAWLIWLEDGQDIRARSIGLNEIVPVDQYPTPTPLPTRTVEATP
jgi:hypothetical protein